MYKGYRGFLYELMAVEASVSREKKYVTISLPKAIADTVDRLIEELGYWPSRGAFVREACLEKIRDERRRLMELREAKLAPEKEEKEEKV